MFLSTEDIPCFKGFYLLEGLCFPTYIFCSLKVSYLQTICLWNDSGCWSSWSLHKSSQASQYMQQKCMSLKRLCPGTTDYSLLKNWCLENIRSFRLGTGGRHQNHLFKMWCFLNLLLMLLARLTGSEMAIFCISPQQALCWQKNSPFSHSSAACSLVRYAWSRVKGSSLSPSWGRTGRKHVSGRLCLAAAEILPPVVTEMHGFLFSVTGLLHYLPSLSLLCLVGISTIRLNILWRWRGC